MAICGRPQDRRAAVLPGTVRLRGSQGGLAPKNTGAREEEEQRHQTRGWEEEKAKFTLGRERGEKQCWDSDSGPRLQVPVASVEMRRAPEARVKMASTASIFLPPGSERDSFIGQVSGPLSPGSVLPIITSSVLILPNRQRAPGLTAHRAVQLCALWSYKVPHPHSLSCHDGP